MKTRKKILIGIGILSLMTLIAGYGIVSACGLWSDPGRGGHSRFQGRGLHSGFHSGDMADFIIWRMEKKAAELNLTETQKAKFDRIKANVRSHLSEGMDDHRRLREQFHDEMDRENPDIRFLVESIKTRVNDMSGFVNENLDLLVDFYESLDGTQQKAIIDEVRERMEYQRNPS